MPDVVYDSGLSMREARKSYFERNGFGRNGGYDDAWVDFKLGPLSLRIPNTASRVRAVVFHDLHHVITGYDTDYVGELEISAWEVGAGCRDFWAAWFINLGGVAGGVFCAPRRTKGAVRSLTRTLARELAPRGIRVNAVSPGPIETNFFARTDLTEDAIQELGANIQAQVPLGRFGRADEVAAVAGFLLSHEASFVTGAEYVVDGGLTQI